MASLQTRNLDLDLQTLGDLLIKRLGLSSDQQALLQEVLDNEPVDAEVVYQIARLQFSGGHNVAPTDLDGVSIALGVDGSAGLQLGLYPAGTDLALADFTLPALHRAQRHTTVAEGNVACGLELEARLGASAKATGGTEWTLALSAGGSLDARIKFFKEVPATGARDLIVTTLKSLSTPFNVLSKPPREGEMVVAQLHGLLKLGADFDYSWTTTGTETLGTGLDNLGLAAEYKADARLGASASFGIDHQVAVIVRSTGQGQWINVSFMKLDDSDAALSLNLDIDSSVHATGDGGKDMGAFVDSLLGRAHLPELMSELRKYDTIDKVKAIADDEVSALVEKLTDAVKGILEGPAQSIDSLLQPVREHAAQLVAAYQQFDANARSFLEKVLETSDELGSAQEALEKIAEAGSVDEILDLLSNSPKADEIRNVLGILCRILGIDLSQLSWLRDKLPALQGFAKKLLALDREALQELTEAYTWFKKQLYLDEIVQRLETLDKKSAEQLLDEKILWLDTYLSQKIDRPVEQLVDHLEPVVETLGKIVAGYDHAVEKARKALEKALDHEVGLQTSLAWRSISTFQTLVSVDVDLARGSGREALKDLIHGDIRGVMQDRLQHADAIRLQKSYFLDQLDRSSSLRVILNGRKDLRVGSALVTRSIEITPTDDGEIWVQESTAQTKFQRVNRRALININTMFQVSLQELFLRHQSDLEGQGASLGQYKISYSQHEEVRDGKDDDNPRVPAAAVIAQLDRALDAIDFRVVSPADLQAMHQELLQIGQLGPLGSPAFDIRIHLASEALYEVFQASSFEVLATRIDAAWDRAVHNSFTDEPPMLRFYEQHKNDVGSLPLFGTQGAAGLNRIQWNDAFNVINGRDSFRDIFQKLYKKVFHQIAVGGQLNLALKNRLQDQMHKLLRKLAEKMRWINTLERSRLERDFAMTVFANLVDPVDRSGSVVVSYVHPISKTTMTLRVDENPLLETS